MILVLLIYILTPLFQIPDLVKKRHWRELAVFLVFYIISFALCFLLAMDVNIPSVYSGVGYFIENILHLSYPQE